jgi:hypothetical protein
VWWVAWVAWVGALAFDVVIRGFLMWMDPTVGSLREIALAGTASLILTGVSAVAASRGGAVYQILDEDKAGE